MKTFFEEQKLLYWNVSENWKILSMFIMQFEYNETFRWTKNLSEKQKTPQKINSPSILYFMDFYQRIIEREKLY